MHDQRGRGREGGPPRADPRPAERIDPSPRDPDTWLGPRVWGLIAGAASLLGLLWILRGVLLPFVIALLLTYVLAPVVRGLARLRIHRWRMPRWGAVLILYLVIAGSAGLFLGYAGPRLGGEIGKLAQETPEMVHRLRTEVLPALSVRLRRLLRLVDPDRPTKAPYSEPLPAEAPATTTTATGAEPALPLPLEARPTLPLRGPPLPAMSAEDPLETWRLAFSDKTATLPLANPTHSTALTIVPVGAGGYALEMGDAGLEITDLGEGRYRIGRLAKGPAETARRSADLGRALRDRLDRLLISAEQHLATVLLIGQEVVGGVMSGLVGLIVVLVVTAFLLVSLPEIEAFLPRLIPAGRRAGTFELLRRIDTGLGGVVRGQLVICLVNGALTWAGLAALDVKFALILAVSATVLSVVPIFGMFLQIVPAMFIAGSDSGGKALLVLGWISIIHFVEAYLLGPKLMSRAARLHPALIIFSLVAGQALAGFAGLLLAVPTLSIVQSGLLFVMVSPNDATTIERARSRS